MGFCSYMAFDGEVVERGAHDDCRNIVLPGHMAPGKNIDAHAYCGVRPLCGKGLKKAQGCAKAGAMEFEETDCPYRGEWEEVWCIATVLLASARSEQWIQGAIRGCKGRV